MEKEKLAYKRIGNQYTGFLYIVWLASQELPPIDWISEEQYLSILKEEKREQRRKDQNK